jgi:hypothetical protein
MPPPYGIIWNRLKAGKVVPFLGAGASFVGRLPDARWDARIPAFLPNGSELAHFLADEAEFPSTVSYDRDDLAKVCSYYVDMGGRRGLRERLREVLNHPYHSGSLHAFLAAVPSPLVIVVTNYDTLLEQAFQDAGKPYDLVVYPADRKDFANAVLWWQHQATQPQFVPVSELDINLATTTVIYKMHGTIRPETDEWDNFVITEEDYIEFLSRMTTNSAVPSVFYPYFRERSFLFLGYSLRDWNLRVVLRNISKYLPKRIAGGDEDEDSLHWAIQRNPSVLESKLWTKRHVNIFDLTLDEFVGEMHKRSVGNHGDGG